jgi:hypothetical protein
MAVCPSLGLLVTSSFAGNTLSVYALPGAGAGRSDGFTLVGTLGGPDWLPAMSFSGRLDRDGMSGRMAFTDPSGGPPLLLLADHGSDAVHIIDVVARCHAGYVGGPGAVSKARDVAATRDMVATSSWTMLSADGHVVLLFQGGGVAWTLARTIHSCGDGAFTQLNRPTALRFSSDGSELAVGDSGCRVNLFKVADGSWARLLATGLAHPWALEECKGVWLVACAFDDALVFIAGDGASVTAMGRPGRGRYGGWVNMPCALALVPDLGLVVRGRGGGDGGPVLVFASPDVIAMDAMSAARVAWMGLAARARDKTTTTSTGMGAGGAGGAV